VHASHRGIGYTAALDEALCFGWIDGVLNPLDEDSFLRRFTPRKATSIWSKVNLRHVARLEAEGRMHAAGRAALARRTEDRTGVYSFESRPKSFPPEFRARLDANVKAARFFDAQPPGVQRLCIHWVVSAKKDETRLRRLDILIASSRKGERIPGLKILGKRPAKKTAEASSGRARAKAGGSGARRSPTRSSRPRSRS
jgi:uncharacterized protein YdeI (YjbR/CyaY-like superfamily)